MTRRPVPWSWLGLIVAGLVVGALLVPLMWLTDQFRQGLDADMVHLWATRTPLDLVGMGVVFGLLAIPFYALTYWVVRIAKLDRVWFIVFPAIGAAGPVLGVGLYYSLAELMPPTRGVVPFEASSLSYLPNYLVPAAIALAMSLGALGFLATARGKRPSGVTPKP
ncbi:MAG: hypothetical protein ACI9YM_002475 [Brevundimonas sp.]|uniref:hypothetical protein n=1 Tax=Brevundimonas sp. TaxID=1871086 RepID=UPI0039E3474F